MWWTICFERGLRNTNVKQFCSAVACAVARSAGTCQNLRDWDLSLIFKLKIFHGAPLKIIFQCLLPRSVYAGEGPGLTTGVGVSSVAELFFRDPWQTASFLLICALTSTSGNSGPYFTVGPTCLDTFLTCNVLEDSFQHSKMLNCSILQEKLRLSK